jgi:hypothetical protein
MELLEIAGSYAEDIVVLMNTDHELLSRLRMEWSARSVVEMEKARTHWEHVNHAATYALVKGGRAVGMGMLAHRDYVLNAAQLSFWLGTRENSRENVDKAFDLLLDKAYEWGLSTVNGAIHYEDEWLIRVWMKNGARRRDVAEGQVYMDISL